MLLIGCAPSTAAPSPTVALLPTATRAVVTATRPPLAATPTPKPTRLETFHAQIAFETYEAEETVQLELGRLPGVASVNVTQLDVTVEYDPTRLSADEILRTLRDNPEVRIKDDARAGQ